MGFFKRAGRHELEAYLKEYIKDEHTLRVYCKRDVTVPERSGRNAGFDFFVPNDFSKITIKSLRSANIPSGIIVKMPPGHALIAFNKSGIAVNYNLQVGACVVDENYTGEIFLNVFNVGKKKINIYPGMKLVQFVLVKVNYATVMEHYKLEEMYKPEDHEERGDKAFGSSGI
mgnify:CR=1 FL=1|tara:strand:+ start:3842 stop:4357 length:516 start_codon:yes stop_codon:yes gene_type:complete